MHDPLDDPDQDYRETFGSILRGPLHDLDLYSVELDDLHELGLDLDLDDLDLDDKAAVAAEVARLRALRAACNRRLALITKRYDEAKREARHAESWAENAAEFAPYHAVVDPVVAATPAPQGAGRTAGEADHAANRWAARVAALRAAIPALRAAAADQATRRSFTYYMARELREARGRVRECEATLERRRAGNRERIARWRARR